MPQLIDHQTGEAVLENLELARTFWQRFKGLQFRSRLPADTGLLLDPCSSLHTCFMRFPIDVIMLDQDNVVVGVRTQVAPWRAVFCPRGTVKVVETTANTLKVSVGVKLQIDSAT